MKWASGLRRLVDQDPRTRWVWSHRYHIRPPEDARAVERDPPAPARASRSYRGRTPCTRLPVEGVIAVAIEPSRPSDSRRSGWARRTTAPGGWHVPCDDGRTRSAAAPSRMDEANPKTRPGDGGPGPRHRASPPEVRPCAGLVDRRHVLVFRKPGRPTLHPLPASGTADPRGPVVTPGTTRAIGTIRARPLRLPSPPGGHTIDLQSPERGYASSPGPKSSGAFADVARRGNHLETDPDPRPRPRPPRSRCSMAIGRPRANGCLATLVPESGWHFLHVFYRVDREALAEAGR